MSDLQLALLGLGAVVIAAVVAYNAMQEKKARGRAEKAFGAHDHVDVLLDPDAVRQPRERLEPTLGDIPSGISPSPLGEGRGGGGETVSLPDPLGEGRGGGPSLAQVRPGRDSVISDRVDTIATIVAPEPIPAERLETLLDALQSYTTPAHVEGIVDGQWRPVEGAEVASWRELRAGLQLASRSGPLSEEEIAAFDETIAKFAESENALSQREAPAEAAARATELDRFCADADLEVAVNVVGQFGATFSLARVKELGLGHGLSETASGELVCRSADGATAFTVRRLDRDGARKESSYATGLTLALDLPHVQDAPAVFEAMVGFAAIVCKNLGGEMVDDNRKPLTSAGIAAIERQVEEAVRRMESHGIPAGGALARRLFA
jgi:hypothetical protein